MSPTAIALLIAAALFCAIPLSYIAVQIYGEFSYGRQLRRDQEARARQSESRIGYKYANIGKHGLLGLASGKSYQLNEVLPGDRELESGAYGFHSYKSLDILRQRSSEEPYIYRGVVVLQVLHYGEIEEYDDGWLSTGQRVLQISVSDQPCFGAHNGTCRGEPLAMMSFPGNNSFLYCRSHFDSAERKTRWIPGRKVVRIAAWLASMEQNVGDRVRIHSSMSRLESVEVG